MSHSQIVQVNGAPQTIQQHWHEGSRVLTFRTENHTAVEPLRPAALAPLEHRLTRIVERVREEGRHRHSVEVGDRQFVVDCFHRTRLLEQSVVRILAEPVVIPRTRRMEVATVETRIERRAAFETKAAERLRVMLRQRAQVVERPSVFHHREAIVANTFAERRHFAETHTRVTAPALQVLAKAPVVHERTIVTAEVTPVPQVWRQTPKPQYVRMDQPAMWSHAGFAPATPAPMVATPQRQAVSVASPARFEPAEVERLAEDVIKRIERRMRIERERRGM